MQKFEGSLGSLRNITGKRIRGRAKEGEEKMKTFTRKKLIQTGIEQIKIMLRLYGKTKDLEYINDAKYTARVMENLEIIELEKMWLLQEIIDKEFKRLLNEEI